MKILIVDRDDLASQLIKSRLEPLGHQITVETDKGNAVETASADKFDIIFIDPSPLTDARSIVLNVRRAVGKYPYIILLTANGTPQEAMKAGANDLLLKPVDGEALDQRLENAERLIGLVKRIGDDSEDFPSAGGVIAKSAFNQLFLSGIDRADRYGESSFVMFISMSNYKEILSLDGKTAADFAMAKLSQHLVRLRRQSDIIGQTEKFEYALLLLPSPIENESVEAAKRFAESIEALDDIASSGAQSVEITITLVDLPAGSNVVQYVIEPGVEQKRSAEGE